MLSRGFDVPEIDLVINFDVPILKDSRGNIIPDYENYLHRIGRAGRFDKEGVSVTLYDREEDERALHEIIKYYGMEKRLEKLEDVM
jgi:ATP-dependent RNA helicase DDX19/DBP5